MVRATASWRHCIEPGVPVPSILSDPKFVPEGSAKGTAKGKASGTFDALVSMIADFFHPTPNPLFFFFFF